MAPERARQSGLNRAPVLRYETSRMEIIPYGGWKRAARLVCGDTELVVTLDIGPRMK